MFRDLYLYRSHISSKIGIVDKTYMYNRKID